MARGDGPGRPPLAVPSRLVRITLSLRPGEDDDLLDFFDAIPPGGRAQAVVVALRQGGVGPAGGDTVVDDDLVAAALDDFLLG